MILQCNVTADSKLIHLVFTEKCGNYSEYEKHGSTGAKAPISLQDGSHVGSRTFLGEQTSIIIDITINEVKSLRNPIRTRLREYV